MNKKAQIVLLLFLPFFATSQIQVTHLLKYSNSINPLFSKKSKQINLLFDKYNLIDSPNSVNHILKIDISERKSELSGVANDFSIGSAAASINNFGILGGIIAGGYNNSKYFTYRNTNGYVLFNKSKFDSLLKYSDNIINLIEKKLPQEPLSITYYFKVDNLELSLEVEQTIDKPSAVDVNGNSISPKVFTTINKKVFLKIDESVFVMSDEEFKTFNDTLLNVAEIW